MDEYTRREMAFRAEMERQRAEQEARRKQQLITAGGALAGALLSYAALRFLNRPKGQEKANELIEDVADDLATQAKQQVGDMFSQAFREQPSQPPAPPPVFRTQQGGEIRDADYEILD